MRALVMTKLGSNRTFELRDVPAPACGDDEVLVEVHAAGLNPVDLKILHGGMKILFQHRLPQIAGSDVAGRVLEVGRHVTRFAIGDEVYGYTGLPRLGAFADRIAVPESSLARKPAALSFAEAASLPLVFLTLRHALVDLAHVSPGQRVFLRAGSGGTGVVGIQLAKALGAEVVTTTSTANVEWVRALGAGRVIDYKTTAFETTVKDCDVAIETMPAPAMNASFAVVKPGGRVVSVGDQPTSAFAREHGLNVVMQWAFAFVSRSATAAAKKAGCAYDFFVVGPNGTHLEELTALVDRGAMKPVIDRAFPIAEWPDAFARLAEGRVRGKLVLTMR